jgi:hypothetical protein
LTREHIFCQPRLAAHFTAADFRMASLSHTPIDSWPGI